MRIEREASYFNSKYTSYGVILSACILVVLGDIRSIVTPLVYWCAWIAVAAVGFFLAPHRGFFLVAKYKAIYLFFFLILFFSFIISALANIDIETLYQGFKILIIIFVFSIIFTHARELKPRDCFSISVISVSVGFLFFCVSKFYLVGFYIELGDGRQGSQFAFPGVMWKTCAFFVFFIVVGLVCDGRSKFVSLFAILAAVYLLIMDASRTGFLVFFVGLLLVGLLFVFQKPKFWMFVFLMISVFTLVFYLLSGLGVSLFSAQNDPLVVERLAAGDPVRAQMLVDGIKQFGNCIPFGCGFGTTTSDVGSGLMVVHNAYLSSGGDLGILGFFSLCVLILLPIIMFVSRLLLCFSNNYLVFNKHVLPYAVAAVSGVLSFAMLLMLHPFSTELSEWGIWILMASILSALSEKLIIRREVNFLQGESK